MITYLLQVAICWGLFLGLYHLTLRKETFFVVNRVYLLLTIVLGLLIPRVTWDTSMFMQEPTVEVAIDYLSYGFDQLSYMISPAETPQEVAVETTAPISTIAVIYWAGVLMMMIKLAIGVIRIGLMYRSAHITFQDEQRIAYTNKDHAPFTFFNTVYLSTTRDELNNDAAILIHEQAHISGWHTLDVLFIELIKTFFWFNPLVYGYDHALKTVHEYIADANVLRRTALQRYGRLLLRQAQPGLEIALANHFYNHQLKERFKMMTRTPSQKRMLIKYLSVLPFILVVSLVFTNQKVQAEISKVEEMENPFIKKYDSYHLLFKLNQLDKANRGSFWADYYPYDEDFRNHFQSQSLENKKEIVRIINEHGQLNKTSICATLTPEGIIGIGENKDGIRSYVYPESYPYVKVLYSSDTAAQLQFGESGLTVIVKDITFINGLIARKKALETLVRNRDKPSVIYTNASYRSTKKIFPHPRQAPVYLKPIELSNINDIDVLKGSTILLTGKDYQIDPISGLVSLTEEDPDFQGNYYIIDSDLLTDFIQSDQIERDKRIADGRNKLFDNLIKYKAAESVNLTPEEKYQFDKLIGNEDSGKPNNPIPFNSLSNTKDSETATNRAPISSLLPLKAYTFSAIPKTFKIENNQSRLVLNIKEPYCLKIYNRLGFMVFTSDDYENEWDGVWNGKELPEDTYFTTLYRGKSVVAKSWIELKRSKTNNSSNENAIIPSTFKIENSNSRLILNTDKSFGLQIFNRWGNQVFKSDDYQNDWDGTCEGKPVNEDTYFANVSDEDDIMVSGYFILERLTKDDKSLKLISPNTTGDLDIIKVKSNNLIPKSYDPNKGPLTIEKDGDYYIEIMNRWGNLVLNENNYDNDWAGLRFGKIIPSDTYAYRLWKPKRHGIIEFGTIDIITNNNLKVHNLTKVTSPTKIRIMNVAKDIVYRNNSFTNSNKEYAEIMGLPDGNYSYYSSARRGIGGWFTKKENSISWYFENDKPQNTKQKDWPQTILVNQDGHVISVMFTSLDKVVQSVRNAFHASSKLQPYPESKAYSIYNINNEISAVNFINESSAKKKFGDGTKTSVYEIILNSNPPTTFSEILNKEKVDHLGTNVICITNLLPEISLFRYYHNYATTEKTSLYIHTLDGSLVDQTVIDPIKQNNESTFTSASLKTKKWPKGILLVTTVIGDRYTQSAILNENKSRN